VCSRGSTAPRRASRWSSLRAHLARVEREGPSHYGEILRERLNGEDLRRMTLAESSDLARSHREHWRDDVRDR
jgi:hypothetical protein